MLQPVINIFPDKSKLATALAADIFSYISRLSETKERIDIALSGGSTPTLLFRALVALNPSLPWEKINFFWVDERCVSPEHEESNFGTANKEFFKPLGIPESSIFRIHGEDDPEMEAQRYSKLIIDHVAPDMTFPVFDLLLLGMGSDGHTASVFPYQIELWNEERLCVVGVHPDSKQNRVSFTGHLINGAERVLFLVAGKDKAEIVAKILKVDSDIHKYPASLVQPHRGELSWYLDQDAASKL